jgi:hypothetical protein
MKKVFLTAALFAASAFAFAQKSGSAFDENTAIGHAGIGIGGGFYTGTTTLPPISVSYEKGITENISVGGIVGYSASKYDDGFGDEFKYTYLLIGARGNYHFGTTDKFDPYVGVTLGYNIVTFSEPGGYSGLYSASGSELLAGAQIGANYYFSDNAGAFAELGYGIGIINVGLTLKL